MDCVAVRRRLGVKHRSFRIWMGWVSGIGSLIIMGLIYYACVMQVWQREDGYAITSLFQSTGAASAASWQNMHDLKANRMDGDIPADFEQQQQQQAGAPSPHLSAPAAISLSSTDACKLVQEGLALVQAQDWVSAIPLLDQGLAVLLLNTTSSNPGCANADVDVDAAIYALARSYAETNQFGLAQTWTDKLYQARQIMVAGPAYHLCRRLREAGHNALAYYYYFLAKKFTGAHSSSDLATIIGEPAVHDYLLDYEKSILWSYVGDIHERHSRLHGLAFSMQMLENPRLPHYLRESVLSNLQYYAVNVRGFTSILRAEKAVDEEWRYSTPTFVNEDDTTLIRVVNYYVAEDGSYRVSPAAGTQVDTKLVLADTDESLEVQLSPAFTRRAAANGLLHPDAYILGVEDTRVVRDHTRNGALYYTLSASQQYSADGRTMNQVLGVLDLDRKRHTIQNVVMGPYPDRHDKNWVFAGGIDYVVYGWYPTIEIGAIDPTAEEVALRIHTTIPTPASFEGMRGSTNGVLYEHEWWFVTHSVIYRPGRMRKYLHRVVALDKDLSKVSRYSLPFTFEEPSDIEYCLGLKVDTRGFTFGYSVRDRSSRVIKVGWMGIGDLFE